MITFQTCNIRPAYSEEACFEEAAIIYPLPDVTMDLQIALLKEIANFESSNRLIWRHPVTEKAPCCDYGRMGINKYWELQVSPKQWVAIIGNDCSNIKFGAFVLQECVERLGFNARGVGCYHSPRKEKAIMYGRAVLARMGV